MRLAQAGQGNKCGGVTLVCFRNQFRVTVTCLPLVLDCASSMFAGSFDFTGRHVYRFIRRMCMYAHEVLEGTCWAVERD